jgi:competence protein ComEC
LASYSYVNIHYRFPEMAEEKIAGKAYLEIHSLSTSSTHFGKFWVYKGTLREFIPDNGNPKQKGKNIPFQLTLPQLHQLKRPLANKDYIIQGKLKKSPTGTYHFSVKKEEPWLPVKGSWSTAEQRYQAKKSVAHYIHEHIPYHQSAVFLSGIATGDFDDRMMQFDFGRFGLQHIMAISGFHFAIIAGILSFLLSFVFSKRKTTGVLIVLLTSYFLFLGTGPSIMRAWLTAMIVLTGLLLEKRPSGLNSLGFAMLVILIYNPLLCQTIGFQFSFLATAAILLLNQGCDHLLQQIWPKRPLYRVIEMDRLNQHLYCLLNIFRQGISLSLAVNLMVLPLLLFYFHKFPILSLVYNLFFPFLVSISMLLLILSVIASFVFFPLGNFLHVINSSYTLFVLNFTTHMPPRLHLIWRVPDFSLALVVLHLCLIFWLGLWFREKAHQRQDEIKDLII